MIFFYFKVTFVSTYFQIILFFVLIFHTALR